MLTLSKLQDNENNFHIPQPEATRPHLQGECVLTGGGGMRPHLGATRPRVGIANLGLDAPSWQYLKYGYSCICKSRPRALTYKCRRGDEAADKIAVYRVKVFLFELF